METLILTHPRSHVATGMSCDVHDELSAGLLQHAGRTRGGCAWPEQGEDGRWFG